MRTTTGRSSSQSALTGEPLRPDPIIQKPTMIMCQTNPTRRTKTKPMRLTKNEANASDQTKPTRLAKRSHLPSRDEANTF